MSLSTKNLCWSAVLFGAAILGGCSGEYIIATPDVVTLPGAETVVVVRLQKREFWRYIPAADGATLMYRCEDGSLRCARTDENGYAGVSITAAGEVGRRQVCLHHQDDRGDTVDGCSWVYVLQPGLPIVAVDLDSLPSDPKAAETAGRALAGLGEAAQVIYVTADASGHPEQTRQRIRSIGLPEAPIVSWRKVRPWYRGGSWRVQPGEELRALRRRLPELKVGITADPFAAETFDRAYMKVVFVGPGQLDKVIPADRVGTWPAVRMPPE